MSTADAAESASPSSRSSRPPASGDPARPQLWPYYVVVGMTMAGFGVVFTLLAEFRDEFGFSDSGVGLIAASGFFAGFVAQVSLARYADRGHSVLMIRAGLALVVTSSTIMVFASSLAIIVAARVLLGVAAGLIVPSVRRIVISTDPDHVGANLGRLGAADIAGFMSGPVIAAALNAVGGLRAPFVALTLGVGVIAPLILRGIEDPGVVDAERRSVRTLLRRRQLVGVILVAIGFFAMIGTFESVWAVLLSDRGADTWVIGLTISMFGIPMIIVSPIGGRVAQQLGPLRVACVTLLVAVPFVLAYGFVTSVVALTVLALVQSLADAVTFPATQVGVAMTSPASQLAAAQGLLGATELGTGGTMALVAGLVYDTWGAGPTFATTASVMALCVGGGWLVAGGSLRRDASVAEVLTA